MKNSKLWFRCITFVLLLAISATAIPVQQLFHAHHFSTVKKQSAKNVTVKKQEKSCCKPFDGLFGTTVTAHTVYTVGQPANTLYILTYFRHFIMPYFDLSNKAPPVSIT